MSRDRKELTLMSTPKIKASAKFWKGIKRHTKNDTGLKKIISHVKFLIDQKKIEKEYGLGPGETLGV